MKTSRKLLYSTSTSLSSFLAARYLEDAIDLYYSISNKPAFTLGSNPYLNYILFFKVTASLIFIITLIASFIYFCILLGDRINETCPNSRDE